MQKKKFDQVKFKKAYDFVYKLHFKQTRKDKKTPYINHLLSVAVFIIDNGGSTEEAIAGLLHDSIEDQGGDKIYNKIKNIFGKKIANLVKGCSEIYKSPKPEWRIRKEIYIKKLEKSSKSIIFISLCDKLHNLKLTVFDLNNEGLNVWKRFNANSKDIFNFYKKLFFLYKKNIPFKRSLIKDYKNNLSFLKKFINNTEFQNK